LKEKVKMLKKLFSIHHIEEDSEMDFMTAPIKMCMCPFEGMDYSEEFKMCLVSLEFELYSDECGTCDECSEDGFSCLSCRAPKDPNMTVTLLRQNGGNPDICVYGINPIHLTDMNDGSHLLKPNRFVDLNQQIQCELPNTQATSDSNMDPCATLEVIQTMGPQLE
jgi:hypothetical protein